MTELITPPQAMVIVVALSIVLTVIGALWGIKTRGRRGLWGAVPGLVILPLWFYHLWLTQTANLSSLKVLLSELVVFAIIGMALGMFFSFVWRVRPTDNSPRQTNGE